MNSFLNVLFVQVLHYDQIEESKLSARNGCQGILNYLIVADFLRNIWEKKTNNEQTFQLFLFLNSKMTCEYLRIKKSALELFFCGIILLKIVQWKMKLTSLKTTLTEGVWIAVVQVPLSEQEYKKVHFLNYSLQWHFKG